MSRKRLLKSNLYRWGALLAGFPFLLTACTPLAGNQSLSAPDQQTVIQTPSVVVEDNQYRTMLPYVPNTTRGTLQELPDNLSIGRLEMGLLEKAQAVFSPQKYIFREGQVISEDEARTWIQRYDPKQNTEGLNDQKGSLFLIQILEHDYVDQNNELKGMAVALTVTFNHTVEVDGETQVQQYSKEELNKKAAGLAGRIVDRLRKKTDVPILVATYAIGQSGYLPGVFTQSALVKEKARTIDNWENIDESYLLLPASLGMGPSDEQLTAQQFTGLKDAVEKAFPNFVTITGMGRFMDQKLSELTIDVSSQFQSKTEVMFVTQLVANQVKQYFNRKVYVSVYVKMINTPQAIYIKRADGTEFFHIYRD